MKPQEYITIFIVTHPKFDPRLDIYYMIMNLECIMDLVDSDLLYNPCVVFMEEGN